MRWLLLLLASLVWGQTQLKPNQLLTCKNIQEYGKVTRTPIQDAVSMRINGPDLTIRVPGYAPITVRIVAPGMARGNGSLSIMPGIPFVLRAYAFMEIQVIAGDAIIKPPVFELIWDWCNGEREPTISISSCGFFWRLQGDKPAKIQRCRNGIPE